MKISQYPRTSVVLVAALSLASALPFGKKKPVIVEEPSSVMGDLMATLSSAASGFFAMEFIWRVAFLLVLDAKFKIREKLGKISGASDEIALLLYFLFWYVLNTKYNEYNKGKKKDVTVDVVVFVFFIKWRKNGISKKILRWSLCIIPPQMCHRRHRRGGR